MASATAPKSHDVKQDTTVAVPLDDAWRAVVRAFAERNWPIKTIDKTSGVIATDWIRVPEEYADCGSAPLLRKDGTRVVFNVLVLADGAARSSITVNTKFEQVRSIGGQVSVIECSSTGQVEGKVHAYVAKHIGRSRAQPVVVAQPVGFFCASSPSSVAASFCARERDDCEFARDAVIVGTGDIGDCLIVEAAWCSTRSRCAASEASCEVQRGAVDGATPSCTLTK